MVTLIAFTLRAGAQQGDNAMLAADSAFSMQVTRQSGNVMISITLLVPIKFKYISVERKSEADANFSQCKYISHESFNGKQNGVPLTTEDNYPFPPTEDVLYRLKVITAEDVVRIYPPVALSALK